MSTGTQARDAGYPVRIRDSATKYPPTISILAKDQAIPTLPEMPRCEMRPAINPSNPLITRVNGAYCGEEENASDSEDPNPPAIPPTTGPKVIDTMNIMISPKLKYPFV